MTEPTPDWSGSILDCHGYVNKCCYCGFHFQHLNKRAFACPSCEQIERSRMTTPDGLPGCDDMASIEARQEAGTDNYYKGRADQASEDLEFYRKVKAEQKANLLAHVKSEGYAAISASALTARLVDFIERQ